MADCAACGTRLEEGVTKCPQCGASLKLPGSFMQAVGWVTFLASSIGITVGIVTAEQRNYLALGIGAAMFVGGLLTVALGRAKARTVPSPTRPSASPAGPYSPPGGSPAR